MKEDKDERIVILSKGVGANYERKFFLDIQDAILNGYRIADNNSRADVSMRMFKGRIGRAVLYLQDEITEQSTEDAPKNPEIKLETKEDFGGLIAKIEATGTYKELKKIAEESNLTMQDKVYNPVAVKKNLLEQLKTK